MALLVSDTPYWATFELQILNPHRSCPSHDSDQVLRRLILLQGRELAVLGPWRISYCWTSWNEVVFMISLNTVAHFPIVGVMMHRIPEAEMHPSTAEDLLAVVTIYPVSTGSR